MSITTSALVSHELNKPLVLEDVVLDEMRPDEAIVEIEASGVCHTDLSCMDGTIPAGFPNVFGHEGAGTVLQTGSAITHVQPGDKVLLSFNHCGDCEHCNDSHPAYCTSWVPLNFSGKRLDGTHTLRTAQGQAMHGTFFGQSSFMRHALVSASSMVKVDAATDLGLFAALGCGFQTGAGCVLNTLRVLIAGAKTIVAVDLNEERLRMARELGATHVVDGKSQDVEGQIRKICEPGNGAQAATVGAPKPGSTVAIDIFQHLILGREYVGSTEGDVDAKTFIPFLIEEHAKGRFPIDKLISYYDIKDYQTAFQDMKATKIIKPVL
ncbi:GroES-like protein, partial [Aspergillus steynii IBT 23096]